MKQLCDYTSEELEQELSRRGKSKVKYCPTCNGKWPMTYKQYKGWGQSWHCDGCNNRIENCTC